MAAATTEVRPDSTRAAGLSDTEAAARLARDGPNQLTPPAPLSRWRILARQFQTPVVALLVAAGAISAGLGELWEAGAILAIVIVNACVSYIQEYRAETAARALRGLTAPRATVVRSGISRLIPAAEVVVGDLVSLQAGDIVAADGRVELARELSVNQAQLTGESLPIAKTEVPGAPGIPAMERTDLVFMASQVTRGTGLVRITRGGSRGGPLHL